MPLKSFFPPPHPSYFVLEDAKVILVTWSSELTANNVSRCILREDLWPWKIHSHKIQICSWCRPHPFIGICVSPECALTLVARYKLLNYPAWASQDHLRGGRSAEEPTGHSSLACHIWQHLSLQEAAMTVCSGQQQARGMCKARLQKQAQPAHCPLPSLPTWAPELPHFTHLLLTSSASLPLCPFFFFSLCPFNAPSWAKPSSGSTQLFTFPTSVSQLLSIAGKTSHPAGGATINFGHQCHLDPCYCQAALLCSPGQLTSHSPIFLIQR